MLITTGEVDTLAELLSSIQKGWILHLTTATERGRQVGRDVQFLEIRGTTIKVTQFIDGPAEAATVHGFWVNFIDIVALHIY